FTTGHAPPSSFDELIRVTQPGGALIFTLATSAYDAGGFKEKLEGLESAGRWRLVEATAPFRGLSASAV
ncbi:MAG TPA: SAM-dependent methyltransferase, partial [Roseiarcus sp.]|nr:SAM-dependent methyltransferase [Roseiarcus sp.]